MVSGAMAWTHGFCDRWHREYFKIFWQFERETLRQGRNQKINTSRMIRSENSNPGNKLHRAERASVSLATLWRVFTVTKSTYWNSFSSAINSVNGDNAH